MSQFTCLLCLTETKCETVSSVLRDDDSVKFQVVRCLHCGHVQLNPLPTDEEEALFYADDRQTKNLIGDTNRLETMRQKSIEDTRRRVDWLLSYVPPSENTRILDIGCGYGVFVDAAIQAGYSATGLDISTDRLNLARQHHQGEFLQGEVDDDFVTRSKATFTAVTLFHVVEHLKNPALYIKHCFELVKPGGYLLVEVPNLADELLQECPPYRAFYWQRAHLSYFDAARLEMVFLHAGITDVKIEGFQRYGLRNTLHWIDEGKPQLAHPDFQTHHSSKILTRLETDYKVKREQALTCDTLIACIEKPKI